MIIFVTSHPCPLPQGVRELFLLWMQWFLRWGLNGCLRPQKPSKSFSVNQSVLAKLQCFSAGCHLRPSMDLTFSTRRGPYGKETIIRPDGAFEIWILAIGPPHPLIEVRGKGLKKSYDSMLLHTNYHNN